MAAHHFFLPLLEPQCQPQSNCRDQGLASAVHAMYHCPAEHQFSQKHSEYHLNYCHMEKGGSKTNPRRPPAALFQHIVLTYYLVPWDDAIGHPFIQWSTYRLPCTDSSTVVPVLVSNMLLIYCLFQVCWSPDIQSLFVGLCNWASLQTIVHIHDTRFACTNSSLVVPILLSNMHLTMLTYCLVPVCWSPDILSLVVGLCNWASLQTVVHIHDTRLACTDSNLGSTWVLLTVD